MSTTTFRHQDREWKKYEALIWKLIDEERNHKYIVEQLKEEGFLTTKGALSSRLTRLRKRQRPQRNHSYPEPASQPLAAMQTSYHGPADHQHSPPIQSTMQQQYGAAAYNTPHQSQLPLPAWNIPHPQPQLSQPIDPGLVDPAVDAGQHPAHELSTPSCSSTANLYAFNEPMYAQAPVKNPFRSYPSSVPISEWPDGGMLVEQQQQASSTSNIANSVNGYMPWEQQVMGSDTPITSMSDSVTQAAMLADEPHPDPDSLNYQLMMMMRMTNIDNTIGNNGSYQY